jgi:O-succinylbenzoic acid--CoA ligase
MNLNNRYLLLNQNKYYLSDIKSHQYTLENKTAFEVATLQFCNAWLNEKKEYTIQTSGSTGNPKSIIINSGQMKMSAIMTLKALDLKENDRALICLSTSFIAGIMMLVRGFEGGLQMIIKEPSSNPLLNLEDVLPINFTSFVPFQLQHALEHKESHVVLKGIKNILIGGAPLSHYLESKISTFTNNIYQTYGMTETVSHIALRRLTGKYKADFYTVLEGIEIGSDIRGCLKIRGLLTNQKWLVTNDLVTLIDHNQFIWRGRVDDVINTGGIKIQVADLEKEIQQIFLKMNISRRFFIAGISSELLGEEIILIIEGNDIKEKTNEVRSELKRNLIKYGIPKNIYFINSFIETPTGKINKKKTLHLLNK